MAVSTIGSAGLTVSGVTSASLDSNAQYYGFKNRIINGAMVIDQRNAGASVTLNNSAWGFAVDRFGAYENTDGVMTAQQSSTVPTAQGFTKSILYTTTTADSSLSATQFVCIRQCIEGNNVFDFGFGAANASTVTLSFWVRSSLTGTFGGCLRNGSGNRTYVYSYTISSANTWEKKTITIAGDTSGTWLTDNSSGLEVWWSLGAGSNYQGTVNTWNAGDYYTLAGETPVIGTLNATFYITGVQLEKGSTATSFDYRPYGTELQLCQRYYETTAYPDVTFTTSATRAGICFVGATGNSSGFNFLVPKRTNAPTVTLYSRNNTSGAVSLVTTGADVTGSTASAISGTGFRATALGTGQTAGAGIETGWIASAEL